MEPSTSKTPTIISFLLPLLQAHHSRPPPPSSSTTTTPRPPFFLGLTGIQGSGKTTLTRTLHAALTSAPHHLRVLTLSLDDLYLAHPALTALTTTHPFLAHRGPPGTHDLRLAERLFSILERQAEEEGVVAVPLYDKSAHGGRGDRLPEEAWRRQRGPWDVVVLEGWCLGFVPLGKDAVERVWRESRARGGDGGGGVLRKCALRELWWVDEQLRGYVGLWRRLGALVQVDAKELDYVYEWRIQQEHDLIKQKGTGMSDEQVRAFVDGYMPSYELYLPGLAHPHTHSHSNTHTGSDQKPHLRFVVGRDRNTIMTEVSSWSIQAEKGNINVEMQ